MTKITANSVSPGESPPLGDGLDLSEPDPRSVFGRLFDEHAGSLHGYLARLVGDQAADDLDGHEGVALGISEDGERQEIILDPDTGEIIGERKVSDSMFAGIPKGTVTSYSSVTTAIVDDMGAKPTS